MAARVYSVSFVSIAAGEGYLVTTVPDGFSWVLRDAIFSCNQNSPDYTMYVSGSERQVLAVAQGSADYHSNTTQWSGRVVLEPGQSFVVVIESGSWDVTICGYQLTLP